MSFETITKELMNAPAGTELVTMTVLVPVWEATAAAHEFPRAGEYVCGSDNDCDIVVPLNGVAAKHCSIYNHNGITTIVPAVGNAVWLNEVAVINPERLQPGDSLAIGPATYAVKERRLVVENTSNDSRIDRPSAGSSTQALVDQIQRLESRIAESEAEPANVVKSPSAAFEARFLSKLPATPIATSRHEQDLVNREEELNRRSEMLQQQLAMFKTRLRDQEQNEKLAENKLQEANAAFEAKQQQQLAEMQRESEKQKAAIDQQTKLIGQQSAALQRKQKGLQQAAAKVEQERIDQERVLAELENVREKEQADLQAQRTQVAAELDKLNQSIAEIAQHHQNAQASTERLRTREDELAGFQEELRHRHESVEATSVELNRRQADLDAKLAAVQEQTKQLDAAKLQLQTEFDERHQHVTTKADNVSDLDAKLQQQAADLAKAAKEFEAEQQRVKAIQEEEATNLEQLRASLEGKSLELETVAASADDNQAALTAAQEQLAAREEELKTLQQQMQERDEQIAGEAAAEIETLRAELNQRQQVAADQHGKIQQSEIQLAERDAECADLRSQLQQKDSEAAATAEQQVADLRARLQEREETLQQRDNDLAELGRELNSQEEEFASQQKKLIEAEQAASAEAVQQIDELRNQLQQREQQLQEMSQRTESHAETEARDAEIRKRELEIQQQVEAVQEQADRLAVMATELDQQKTALDQQTVEQQQKLDEQTADIDAKRAAIESTVGASDTVDAEASRLQQAELDSRQAELDAWAKELDSRHNEVADRLQQLKRLSAESKTEAPQVETPSVAQSFEFQQQVENARRQAEQLSAERDQLVVERDQLTTALNELKVAFESARDEVAANASSTSENQSKPAEETDKLLAEHLLELEQANERAKVAEVENQQLTAQIGELTERLDVQELQVQQMSEFRANAEDSETEAQLLQQLEELKAEMDSASAPEGPAVEVISQLAEQEQTIQDLRDALQQATERLQSQEDTPADPEHVAIIAELKTRLEDQQQTISELNSRSGSAESAEPEGVEEAERLHRELDERTNLLDVREGEIRERQRMLEQSTSDIEEQRRSLLEARQQLELARAEIQLAAEPTAPEMPMETSPVAAPEIPEFTHELETSGSADEPAEDPDSTQAVRSEIAELFGLGDQKTEAPSATATHSELPAVDDYSQETSAAVSMSFSQGGNVLLEAPVTSETEEPEDVNEGDADDFVASYMEQLLARNRTSAGGSLPAELTSATKSEPKAKPKKEAENPKPPGQKSFIDAYMSGEYNSDGDGDSATDSLAEESLQSAEPIEPAAPRAKIDLQSLRNDMNSFRELSTKSVENALASHAKRQVRGGITTRVTIFLSLLVVTLFVLCVALLDVIPFGVMCWLAILATAVSGIELALTMSKLKKKVQGSTLAVDQRSQEQVEADAAKLREPGTPPQQSTMYGPENAEDTVATESEAERVPPPPRNAVALDTADDQVEELDEEYFEL